MAPSSLPEGYQEYGNRRIKEAGRLCGMEIDDTDDDDDDDEKLGIEWKPGKIVVTVYGDAAILSTTSDEEEEDDDDDDLVIMDSDDEDFDEDGTDADGDEFLDTFQEGRADAEGFEAGDILDGDSSIDEIDEEDDDDDDDDNLIMESATNEDVDGSQRRGAVNLAQLARAINAALDDEGIGLAIAESHEIEVTTPGIKDELVGDVMFKAYRGFDVICQQIDTKTQKVKTVEGRLVERNDEFTILNIKGRTKKMKNGTVLSVKLPKAKKEKGKG
jgi:ribosome maturation factor RimP